MKPLDLGEFLTTLAPAIRQSYGVSFIDVHGQRNTYWMIRDTAGQFVAYSQRSYLEVNK